MAARWPAEKHPTIPILKAAISPQALGCAGAQAEGCHGVRPYNRGSHPSACMWGSACNAIKGAEGRGGNQKTCLTGREQEKGGRRERERMWAGDKTAWPYLGCCAILANAEAFSFREGVSTAFAASRDALPAHRPPLTSSRTWTASGREKFLQPLRGEGIT